MVKVSFLRYLSLLKRKRTLLQGADFTLNKIKRGKSHSQHNRILRKRLDQALPYALSAPAMLFVVLFLLVPLGYCFYCSFWRCDYMHFTKFIGLGNYFDTLTNSDTLKSIGLSFYISFVSLAIALTVGILMALWINSAKGGFAYVLEIILLVPWVTSQVVAAMLWKWLLKDETGLINYLLTRIGWDTVGFLSNKTLAVYSLIGVMTWRVIGYVMVQMVAGLKAIPKEYDEAGVIDGANKWQLFWQVRVPQLKAPMAISAIIVALSNLNNVTVPLTMTGGGPGKATTVISILAYRESFSYYHFGEASALSIALCVINFILTVMYVKAVKYEL